MATTTNYGWETPDDTDLVKDGAAAIRTLGTSVDTTTKNLNPETTLGDIAYRSATANVNTRLALGTANQVLRVNSGGTAPEWATTADQTPLTTKGDLFGFDTADARIPIGTNGHILTADSTQSLGLKWAAAPSSLPANDSATVAGANVEGTTSASFTNLATSGPAVTVTTGTKALVIISAQLRPTGASNPVIGYAVSGATTVAADDSNMLMKNWGNDEYISASYAVIKEGLTAGSNTFTLKYKNEGTGTADFRYRFISVVDMGS